MLRAAGAASNTCASLSPVSLASAPLPRPAPSSSRERCSSSPAEVQRGSDAPLHHACRRTQLAPALQALPMSSAVEAVDPEEGAPPRPSPAETARTVLEIAAHGTLATIDEDGRPLGTYSSYVLDGSGQPLLRLRAGAVHTANLLRSPHCSLFVQANEEPARLLARVTLRGHVEEVVGPEAASAAGLHRLLHGVGAGVDAPQDSDLYYRLVLDVCFYVGGLGAGASAEVIPAAVLQEAEPDRLRACAPSLVAQWNLERAEDVLRIAAETEGAAYEELADAQMLWVDRLGMYLYIKRVGEDGRVRRKSFVREVSNERDARSVLTMLAQVSWEKERKYQPVMPVLAVGDPDEIAV